MSTTLEKLTVIVGYVIAIFIPLIGIIAGIVLYFTQKENPFYQKHAKYIMILAVAMWILNFIVIMI